MQCGRNDQGCGNVCHDEDIKEDPDAKKNTTKEIEKKWEPVPARANQNALIPRTRLTSPVNRNESRTGRRSRSASSDGSEYHPSMGIPFA